MRPQGILPVLLVVLAASNASGGEEDLSGEADLLGRRLREAAQDKMGLTAALSSGLEAARQGTDEARDDPDMTAASALSVSVRDKIQESSRILRDAARSISSLYVGEADFLPLSSDHLPALPPPPESCCQVPRGLLQYDPRYGVDVNEALACRLGGEADEPGALSSNVTLALKSARSSSTLPGLKWQYFISAEGEHLEYPAARISYCGLQGDSRHRAAYLSALHGRRKSVVLVLDRGVALGDLRGRFLDAARGAVRYVLSTLTPSDRLGFVAAAGSAAAAYFPLDPDCASHSMAAASAEAKLEVLKFINVVRPAASGETDHAAALRSVAELIRNSERHGDDDGRESPVHVLYISRGRLAKDEVKHEVFKTRDDILSEVAGRRVVLSTYCLAEEDEITEDSQFLEQLASGSATAGQIVRLSRPEDLGRTIGDYFVQGSLINDFKRPQVSILSWWDDVGRSLVISFSLPVVTRTEEKVIGVTGLDVDSSTFLEDFVSYSGSDDSYPCLLERSGMELKVIYHPDSYNGNDPSSPPVTLADLEEVSGSNLESHLLTTPSRSMEAGGKSYIWKEVEGLDYIALVIKKLPKKDMQLPATKPDQSLTYNGDISTAPPRLFYHRLDLLPPKDQSKLLCTTESGRLSSSVESGAGAVFLSRAAFSSSPSGHHAQSTSPSVAQGYMAYLNDRTGLISNPGLAGGVKRDLLALSPLISEWQEQNSSEEVMERFAAAAKSGLMVSYPASSLPTDFHFSDTDWHRNAVSSPGRLAVFGPSLHPSGLGYAATLSMEVGGFVVGTSVPIGFLARILAETLPECTADGNAEDGTRCFLFDGSGTLVYHPVMTDPSYSGPVEHQHLNHKEPNVGKDLLTRFGGASSFVEKQYCKSYLDKTVRRHYSYNESLEASISGYLHGAGAGGNCSRYSISAVPGAVGLFLGVVRFSCPVAAVFCPCSVNGRRCIVCEQSLEEAGRSCECPCECPLELGSDCRHRSSRFIDPEALPVCERRRSGESGQMELMPEPERRPQQQQQLASCSEGDEDRCLAPETKFECLSSVGCSWCEAQRVPTVDQEFTSASSPTLSPLPEPYCSRLETCFGGVLGAPSPYEMAARGGWHGGAMRDRLLRHPSAAVGLDHRSPSSPSGHRRGPSSTSTPSNPPPSPVGPVVGGIMVFFLFLVLSAFCYRHKLAVEGDGNSCGRLLMRGRSSSASNRGSHHRRVLSNIEVDEEEEMREMRQALALENPLPPPPPVSAAVMSPYRMNPGYLRPAPPPGTDSDVGYSTMTPTVVNGGGVGAGGNSTSGVGGDLDSEVILPYTASETARSRLSHRQHRAAAPYQTTASVTSGVSSRTSSPGPPPSLLQQQQLGRLQEQQQQQPHEVEEDAVFLSEDQEQLQQQTPATKSAAATLLQPQHPQPPPTTVLSSNQLVVAATVHEVDMDAVA